LSPTGQDNCRGIDSFFHTVEGRVDSQAVIAAFDALAPAQSGQSGKVLGTNGTTTSWVTASAGTVTSVSGTAPVAKAAAKAKVAKKK
jgi:hypothetical protein